MALLVAAMLFRHDWWIEPQRPCGKHCRGSGLGYCSAIAPPALLVAIIEETERLTRRAVVVARTQPSQWQVVLLEHLASWVMKSFPAIQVRVAANLERFCLWVSTGTSALVSSFERLFRHGKSRSCPGERVSVGLNTHVLSAKTGDIRTSDEVFTSVYEAICLHLAGVLL